MKNKLKEILTYQNISIKEVLKKLNKHRTLYVVDKFNKLQGSITDGDIRRYFIKKNIKKNQSIKKIFNKKVLYYYDNYDPLKLKSILSNKIKNIPIVNKKKIIIDIFDGSKTYIPIYAPYINGNEKKYVNDALDSGWISSTGKYVSLFEKRFKQYTKCKYALSVNNGTSAIQLALMTLGIRPGDEIIVPGLTFYAPMNAIINMGAKPVPIDVSLENFCIDLDLIEKRISKKTKAIIIVHLYGFPVQTKKLNKLKKKYRLSIIEDCAEALGSFSKNRHVGIDADISTFSFFGNKTITTGEGGMFVTNNKKIYELACIKKNHGMSKNLKYFHLSHGLNFRMTNIQAAIGLAQIEQINNILNKKRAIIRRYQKKINQIADVRFQPENEADINSYWLFVIKLDEKIAQFKDDLIKVYQKNKYDVRRIFFSLDEMPVNKFYSKFIKDLKNSKILSKTCISLPSFPSLPISEVDKIVNILDNFIKSKKK